MTRTALLVGAVLSILWMPLAVPAATQELWTASGCCSYNCPGGGGSGCGSETFGSSSQCNARLSQGSAICNDYNPGGGCTVAGFSVTWTCTCTSGCVGGGGGGGGGAGGGGGGQASAAFDYGNPVINNMVQNLGGVTPAGGVGGLANDVGTSVLIGPEQGRPTFTPHVVFANRVWMDEAGKRRRSEDERERTAKEGCRRIVQHGGPANFIYPCGNFRVQKGRARWVPSEDAGRRPPLLPSPVGGLTQADVPATTADYEERFLSNGTVYTSISDLPGGTPITGEGGLPVGGAGVSQGPPDKQPPPSPESPLTPQRQGKTQGRCRDGTWFFNSETQQCYPTRRNCEAAGTRPDRQCNPSLP